MEQDQSSNDSQYMPHAREIRVSDNSAKKADDKNKKQSRKRTQTQQKILYEKNDYRRLSRALLKYIKQIQQQQQKQQEKNCQDEMQQQQKILSDETIHLIQNIFENKKNQVVLWRKYDLIKILSLQKNWKKFISFIEVRKTNELIMLIKNKDDWKKFMKEIEENQKKGQQDLKIKDIEMENMSIPISYFSYCHDRGNEANNIPLNIILSKIILKIYLYDKFPEDKVFNSRNIQEFFQNFFNCSPQESQQKQINEQLDELVEQIKQCNKDNVNSSEIILNEADFMYIKRQNFNSLQEFEKLVKESEKTDLLPYIQKLREKKKQQPQCIKQSKPRKQKEKNEKIVRLQNQYTNKKSKSIKTNQQSDPPQTQANDEKPRSIYDFGQKGVDQDDYYGKINESDNSVRKTQSNENTTCLQHQKEYECQINFQEQLTEINTQLNELNQMIKEKIKQENELEELQQLYPKIVQILIIVKEIKYNLNQNSAQEKFQSEVFYNPLFISLASPKLLLSPLPGQTQLNDDNDQQINQPTSQDLFQWDWD